MGPLPLAQALIQCPSITPDEAGALDVLEAALKPLGFSTWRLPYEGDGGPRTDNLFARLGHAEPHFCFAGHADVVPPGELNAWSVNPFAGEVKDGYLYGRGAEDMKAAIACFVAAVAQLIKNQTLTGSISLLITCDEEGSAINGTRKAMEWMRAHHHIPDMILVGEPTNPSFIGEMVKIGRRGSLNAQLTVRGHQGHVAYPQLANNPVTRLVNILHALKAEPIDSGMEFFLPSNLEVVSVDVGNPADNVIPAQASARFNIRFNPLHSGASLSEWLHAVCNTHTNDYSLNIRVSGEAFLTPPGEVSALVSRAVQEVIGREPELSTTGGTSDARFLRELCPVIEFGTTNMTAHKVDERVKLADLEILTRCYTQILKRFFT